MLILNPVAPPQKIFLTNDRINQGLIENLDPVVWTAKLPLVNFAKHLCGDEDAVLAAL
jgi:hypothetical protein